jgi:hypothetical protein
LHKRGCLRREVLQARNVNFVDYQEGGFVAEERLDGVEELALVLVYVPSGL